MWRKREHDELLQREEPLLVPIQGHMTHMCLKGHKTLACSELLVPIEGHMTHTLLKRKETLACGGSCCC